MMEIFQHEHIKTIREFHQNSLALLHTDCDVASFLSLYAEELSNAYEDRIPAIAVELNNYFKPAIGKSVEEVFSMSMLPRDFLDAATAIFGFARFSSDLENIQVDADFEKAVDVMLAGDLEVLESLLIAKPTHISQHSSFGHRAQLIHYCASNAVEMYRQVVPMNLAAVVSLLMEYGADPSVKIPVYGGEFDFFELFTTSAHPYNAGLADEVLSLFRDK